MTSLMHVTGLVALFCVLSTTTFADDHISSGVGGETCGDNVCLKNKAFCDESSGKCLCKHPPFVYGDGRINCYRQNTFRTEIYNDPNVKTYNNNTVGLPLPCRYLWSHTVTFLKNKIRQRVGFCEAEVFAFHEKWRGKFFVAGFDIAIRVTYDNGTVKEASIRKYGKASNGVYEHCTNATDDQYLPQGPFANDFVKYYDPNTNLLIKCQYDDDDNLAVLHMKKCGLRLQLRPYDCTLRRRQAMIPHASLEVNCAFHPAFMQQDKVVAISPAKEHQGGPTIEGYLLPGLDWEETMIYRAIHSGAAQNGPHATDQCAIAKDVMSTCDSGELDGAFENCMWILKSPRFIRCYDPSRSGEKIMELFNKCFRVYCDFGDCDALINEIMATGCHAVTPIYSKIIDFVSGAKCPFAI